MELNGAPIHLVGMARKEKRIFFYALEKRIDPVQSYPVRENMTNRESMSRTEGEQEKSLIGTRSIQNGEHKITMQSGSCGNLIYEEWSEEVVALMRFQEQGWQLPEDSTFYQMDWKTVGITVLESAKDYEQLPVISGEVEITIGASARTLLML